MKKLFLCAVIAMPLLSRAQATLPDTTAIRIACENYVGGFYAGDGDRVEKAVHTDLVKRIVAKQQDYKIMNMPAADLINAAKNHRNAPDKNPAEPFKLTVQIYDVANGIACAKITTNKMSFFDYVQLAKIKDEWKIINVLWAYNQ